MHRVSNLVRRPAADCRPEGKARMGGSNPRFRWLASCRSIAAIVIAAFSPAALATDYVWSGGDFAGPGVIWSPDTLSISAGPAKTFDSVEFRNAGTVIWHADDIGFISSEVVNDGLWDARSDSRLVNAGGSRSHFVNKGSLRKSGGSGTTSIGGVEYFSDGGTVDTQTGTIDFSGGLARFDRWARFTGSGVVKVSADASFGGDIHSDNLVLAAGRFTGESPLARLYGATSWTGGSFSGSWQLKSGQSLVGQVGLDKSFSTVDFTNDGTITWQTANPLRLYVSSFQNNGLLDLKVDASLVSAGGSASIVENHGILRKSGGTLSTIGGNIAFTSFGTVDAQIGTIDFAGGNVRFHDSSFVGAGVNRVSGGASFHARVMSSNLVLAGGTFTAEVVGATIEGRVQWTGGSFAGAWAVAPDQALVGGAGTAKTFSSASFFNEGRLEWKTADDMRFVSSSFENAGLVDLQADADLVQAGGNVSSFVNRGILRKSAGAVSRIVDVAFSNPGTLDVRHGGQLVLPNDFTNAGTIMGDGVLQCKVLTNSGHVAPGEGIGKLDIVGDFVQTDPGVLDIELGSGRYDLLSVWGKATLSGTLALSCVGDCRYAVGEELVVVHATGGLGRSEFLGPPTLSGFGSGAFEVTIGFDHVRLRVLEEVTPVPEPGIWAMLLVGLGAVALAKRRRMPSNARTAHGG